MNEAYQAAENHETEPMLIRIPPAPGNCNPIGPATTTGGHPINVTDPGQIIIPEVTTDDENNGNVENHCVLRCATGLLGCVAVVLQLTPIYALNWAYVFLFSFGVDFLLFFPKSNNQKQMQ